MLTGAEERLHGFTTILSYAEKPPMAQSFFFWKVCIVIKTWRSVRIICWKNNKANKNVNSLTGIGNKTVLLCETYSNWNLQAGTVGYAPTFAVRETDANSDRQCKPASHYGDNLRIGVD